jgi:hypothetical protein
MKPCCKRSVKISGAIRPWALLLIGVIGIAWLAVVIVTFVVPPGKEPQAQSQIPETSQEPQVAAATAKGSANSNVPLAAQPSSTRRGVANPTAFLGTSATLKLVESLARPETTDGVMTEAQIASWQEHFQNLLQLGSAAIPAIHQFLQQNIDLDFGSGGKQILGYASARMAILDALAQIGGADAVNTLSETLQATADPREVAFVARKLEQLEPGRYQQAALDAARQSLSMAGEGNLNGKDVAPLFELFQKFGDLRCVTDIESSVNKWNFYATLALAQLPDGAGVPSLVNIVTDQTGGDSGARMAALKMLAQVATQSEQAHAALLDQARLGKFSAYDFAIMAPMLAGDQMVYQSYLVDNPMAGINPIDLKKTLIPSSNQSFFTAPLGAATPDQVRQRNALIDELLSVTQDAAMRQSLQQAQTLLSRRSTQIAGK